MQPEQRNGDNPSIGDMVRAEERARLRKLRFVCVPEETAKLIQRAFLPVNPGKMRGYDVVQRRAAVVEFGNAIDLSASGEDIVTLLREFREVAEFHPDRRPREQIVERIDKALNALGVRVSV